MAGRANGCEPQGEKEPNEITEKMDSISRPRKLRAPALDPGIVRAAVDTLPD